MSDRAKRKRLSISLTPTPAEIWARDQRSQAYRAGVIDQLLKDAKDG